MYGNYGSLMAYKHVFCLLFDFVARKTYTTCFCKQKIKQFTLYKVTTKMSINLTLEYRCLTFLLLFSFDG